MSPKLSSNSSPSTKLALVLDVGTTGVRAVVFDQGYNVISRAYKKLKRSTPKLGWVEQSPLEILNSSKLVLRQVVRKVGLPAKSYVGFGLTNQRESSILWDSHTGRSVYPSLVWQDSRTKGECNKLEKKYGQDVRQKTGLAIDSYFSASKIGWVLQNVPKARSLLGQGRLRFGTVDSWLIWYLLENNPHLTDYTNASRTLLFNIKTLRWDKNLLDIFNIPKFVLPKVKASRASFGILKKDVVGFTLPTVSVIGDQQASSYAAGSKPGTTKVTFGTGAFAVQVLGKRFVIHKPLFTTLVPNQKGSGKPLYAVEGKISDCGARFEKVLKNPAAFRKLSHVMALEVNTFMKLLPKKPKELIVDGGVVRDGPLPDVLAKVTGIPVKKQAIPDGTALGVAKLIIN